MPITILSKELYELYGERPMRPLYHYTSLSGLMGIVESKSLFATDIRFFNDSGEMQHTATLLRHEIAIRLEDERANTKLLGQFQDWVNERLTNGHMLFVVSFTTNGNLLSQWRGYCPKGKGVSIGFLPEDIRACSDARGFLVARCRYDPKEQRELAARIVNVIEDLANERGENLDPSERHPLNSYHDIFEEVENELLKVAAILKHPSFREEEEWRVVSPITTNYVKAPILYREGASMLTPYIEFSLPEMSNGALLVEHVFLGPTPNVGQSMTSMSRYLSKYEANPRHGLTYCGIPYRDW